MRNTDLVHATLALWLLALWTGCSHEANVVDRSTTIPPDSGRTDVQGGREWSAADSGGGDSARESLDLGPRDATSRDALAGDGRGDARPDALADQRPPASGPSALCTQDGQVVAAGGIPVTCETLCVCMNMVDDGNCHAAFATRELCIQDCRAKKLAPAQLCCRASRCTNAHFGSRMSVPGFTFKGPPMPQMHHELCREVRFGSDAYPACR